MANYFINDMNTSAFDAIDDETLAEALLSKADKATTYTKLEANTTFATQTSLTSQLSNLETSVTSDLESKANSNEVYNKTQIDQQMQTKAPKSTTYTKTQVNTELAKKVDNPENDTFVLTTALNSNMALKQDV